MAKAAVIIPHYNDVARLARCLAALMPTVPADVEVLVVDNGSSEPLDVVRHAHPGLRIVTETRKGAACARNRGVMETTAPSLFFLDCDCVPDSDWLATALQISGQGDLVGGAIRVFDETPPPRNGAQAFEAVFAFDNGAYVAQKGFSVTANLLTRRDVFLKVGEFVPGLSEDLDWCHRARAMGYRLIYAPNLRVAHPSRGDWDALERKWQRLTKESFGVNGNSPAARLRWVIRAMLMPLSVVAHLPRIIFSDTVVGWGERLAAMKVLARLRMTRAAWMLRQAAGYDI